MTNAIGDFGGVCFSQIKICSIVDKGKIFFQYYATVKERNSTPTPKLGNIWGKIPKFFSPAIECSPEPSPQLFTRFARSVWKPFLVSLILNKSGTNLPVGSSCFGRSAETRTPCLLVPNIKQIIFQAISGTLQPFRLENRYSLSLLCPLFPYAPKMTVG